MKLIKKLILFFVLFFCFQSLFADSDSLGSGKKLDGNIVVISIFADDKNSNWGEDRIHPYSQTILNYMQIATKWIYKNVRSYGVSPNFIFDFFRNGGIYYRTKFDIDLTSETGRDNAVWNYIDTKIDLDWIKKTYKTDNFFFIVYVNTEAHNSVASTTRRFYPNMLFPYEIIYMNRYRDFVESSPSIFAHEILHVFGARDLFYADNRNGFSSEFIDFCRIFHSNDIMFTISDKKHGGIRYEKITNELSDLDAYYLNLIDSCDEIEEYNLPKNEKKSK